MTIFSCFLCLILAGCQNSLVLLVRCSLVVHLCSNSVSQSVCLSETIRYCVETAEHIAWIISPPMQWYCGSAITLVSATKFPQGYPLLKGAGGLNTGTGIEFEEILSFLNPNSTDVRMSTTTMNILNAHITPLLRELHWLKITERIQFRLYVFAYRCLHGSAPQYLAETLHLTSDTEACRRLRSGSTLTLFVPATRRSSLGDWAFPVAAARSWNTLCEQFLLT